MLYHYKSKIERLKMKNEKVNLQRVYERPVKIFNKQLKVTRVILIASVFLIYCGMMYYEIDHPVFLVMGLIPLTILAICFILMKSRILYFGEQSLECSSAGDLYITVMKGTCPKCQGDLKIKKFFSKAIIECQKNKQHTWNLDEKEGKKIN